MTIAGGQIAAFPIAGAESAAYTISMSFGVPIEFSTDFTSAAKLNEESSSNLSSTAALLASTSYSSSQAASIPDDFLALLRASISINECSSSSFQSATKFSGEFNIISLRSASMPLAISSVIAERSISPVEWTGAQVFGISGKATFVIEENSSIKLAETINISVISGANLSGAATIPIEFVGNLRDSALFNYDVASSISTNNAVNIATANSIRVSTPYPMSISAVVVASSTMLLNIFGSGITISGLDNWRTVRILRTVNINQYGNEPPISGNNLL